MYPLNYLYVWREKWIAVDIVLVGGIPSNRWVILIDQ